MPQLSDTQRLNKLLAFELGLSRRAADELIEQGKIRINDETAQLGARVSHKDTVYVHGKKLEPIAQATLLAFHKPIGYVSSRKKQGDSETIYALLPEKFHTLKPVGRLDRDSSGLLLLTNDGDLAFEMTHPKFRKTKIYEVVLDQPLQPLHRQMISDFGVMLPDGKSQFELERLNDSNDTAWRITMSEGRNRQIRRTFSALGYEVTKLHRTQFGPYALNKLAAGDYEIISK